MADIAACTSVHNYSRWLDEWADGLLSQTRRPDQVCIVDNGSDDGTPANIQRETDRLKAAGIRVDVVTLPWTVHYARARNIAIGMSDTVWTHHYDADDQLKPWAYEDWERLAPSADVVSFGWVRGRKTREKDRVYSDHEGAGTLASKAPASAVSPFRRSLWERSPYRDDLPGSWDTALWIGFAHLDARFRATSRACYLYRFHPDSLFVARPAADKKQIGVRLQQLRRSWLPDVSVVVPRRGDDGPRDASWQWVRRRYEDLWPDWEIVVHDVEGEWNKPTVLNEAVKRASGRVLVVTDSDILLPAERTEAAVAAAHVHGWVMPHSVTVRLSEQETGRILQQNPSGWPDPDRTSVQKKPYQATPGGGIFMLTRTAWDDVGGFDPTFRGWGFEDDAWGLAADTLLPDPLRMDGDLWHLWHPPGPRSKHPQMPANRRRLSAYRQVAGDRHGMWELTRHGRTTVAPKTSQLAYVSRKGQTVKVWPGTKLHQRVDASPSWRLLDPTPAGPSEVRHAGGGWYEIVRGGHVVDKVRGREAAEAKL